MMLLHTCADLEPLINQLASRLRVPLADPMSEEIIVVPVADMANHLKRELGKRLGTPGKSNGIVANVRFVYPRQLINATAQNPIGVASSPWDNARLAWSIASVLSERGINGMPGAFTSKPLSSARRVAALFDRYVSHRPGMMRGWAAGNRYDVASNGAQNWQVDLYGALSKHLENVDDHRRTVDDTAAFAAGVDVSKLPERISVFGFSGLSHATADVLRLLGTFVDVAIYWLYAAGEKIPSGAKIGTRRIDYDQTAIVHPLHARWSSQALETRALLTEFFPGHNLLVENPLPRGTSMLHRFQQGVIDDTLPAASLSPSPDEHLAGDGSIQIHACYGIHRQVEALRDALLHALNDDPTLRLKDILVVCSDVAATAPVLQSILNPNEPIGEGVPLLPINVVRGSLSRPDEITQAFFEVLQLLNDRCSASTLLEVAALGPVRRAFGIDDDALSLLGEWTEQLGVQFGLDPGQRARWGISPAITSGTWSNALERLVMGIAVPAEHDVLGPGNVVPFDAVSSSEMNTVGILAEFLGRITALVDQVRGPKATADKTLDEWLELLQEIIDSFIDVPRHSVDMLARLQRSLRAMRLDLQAEVGMRGARLPVAELLSLTTDYVSVDGSDYWSNKESITVAGFGEMNAIPYRVIAFVGADESAFAGAGADGDDVLSNEPRVGEPQYSLQGRQALLQLLMAARDRVVITCTGSDINNNRETPLAVPINELLTVLAGLSQPPVTNTEHKVLTRHSRHNFDIRNLRRGLVREDTPYTFDDNSLEVWRHQHGLLADLDADDAVDPRATAANALTQIISLDNWGQIVSDPISYYYKHVLNVSVSQPVANDSDSYRKEMSRDAVLRMGLSNLEHATEGRALLRLVANHGGPHIGDWVGNLVRNWQLVRPLTGMLPPGEAGRLVATSIATEVTTMIHALPPHLQSLQGTAVDAIIKDGADVHSMRIADVVTTDDTDEFVRARYKRFKDAMMLEAWVELVMLTLHTGGRRAVAHLVSRNEKSGKTEPDVRRLALHGDDDASRLAHARRAFAAMRSFTALASTRPIDFFPETAHDMVLGKGGRLDQRLKQEAQYNPEMQWHIEGRTWADLTQTRPTAEELKVLGVGPTKDSQMKVYADHLWGQFTATCAELDGDVT